MIMQSVSQLISSPVAVASSLASVSAAPSCNDMAATLTSPSYPSLSPNFTNIDGITTASIVSTTAAVSGVPLFTSLPPSASIAETTLTALPAVIGSVVPSSSIR